MNAEVTEAAGRSSVDCLIEETACTGNFDNHTTLFSELLNNAVRRSTLLSNTSALSSKIKHNFIRLVNSWTRSQAALSRSKESVSPK